MIIARRMLRDRRRSLLLWSIGAVIVALLILGMYPSFAGMKGLETMFEQLPAPIKAMAGAGEGISILSAAGFVHGRLFGTFAPLLLTIFGIGLGARAIGGAERDGTLELLLANPVSRRRLLIERYAVVTALVAALGLVIFASTALLSQLIGHGLQEIHLGRLAAATAACAALALLHASIAFAAGCVTGRSGTPVATVVAVGGYLLHLITVTTPNIRWLGDLSPWRWYLDRTILVDGPALATFALPLIVSGVLAIAGGWWFVRRDLR